MKIKLFLFIKLVLSFLSINVQPIYGKECLSSSKDQMLECIQGAYGAQSLSYLIASLGWICGKTLQF